MSQITQWSRTERVTKPHGTGRPSRSRLGLIGLIAAIAGAFVLQIALATGPYIPSDLKVVGRAKPAFVDIDRDGDLDAFVGEVDRGQVIFFRNTGSASSPFFVRESSANNPLSIVNGANIQLRAAPAFVDIDGDTDQDVFVGSGIDTVGVRFFRNTTAAAPGSPVTFASQATPLVITAALGGFTPAFADLDRDNDFDALVGNDDGTIRFFLNTGTVTVAAFTEQTTTSNPFTGVDVGFDSAPTFVDIDNDVDRDVFIGSRSGEILFYRNNGEATGVQTFTPVSGVGNPLSGVNAGTAVNEFSSPTFANTDNDGDLDAYIGHTGGQTRHYRNIGSATVADFGTATPILDNLFDIGLINPASETEMADLDGDGDKDALFGIITTGTIDYYENVGTGGVASFARRTGTANPFDLISYGFDYLHPTLADIDADGDLDLILGTRTDNDNDPNTTSIRFYRNKGTVTAPLFEEETTNPFSALQLTGGDQSMTFGDFLDSDGDLDMILGNNSGDPFNGSQPGQVGPLRVYQNTGTTTVPVFELTTQDSLVVFPGLTTPVANPSGGAQGEPDPVENFTLTPRLIDYDGDGDLDLFVGQRHGYMLFFRNEGINAGVLYFIRDDANNPFNGMDFSSYVRVAFIDVDGDGDLDSYFSSEDLNIVYWRNLGAPGTPAATVGSTTPTSVVINWTIPAPTPATPHAPTHYRIERSLTGTGGWTQLGAELLGSVTTLTDSGLTTNTPYFYRVTALYRTTATLGGPVTQQIVASSPSNVISATPGLPPLIAPTMLVASAVSSSQINLSWSDSNADETGFRIERSPNGLTGWTEVGTSGADATSFSDNGLTAGTTYHYRVIAVRNSATSAPSNVANATTGLLSLIAPTGLTASAVSATQINLSWSDSNTDETGFRIERSLDGLTGWTEVGTAGPNATSFSDNGLTAGTTYHYRVIAVRNIDTSVPSNVANATTTQVYKAYLPLTIRP